MLYLERSHLCEVIVVVWFEDKFAIFSSIIVQDYFMIISNSKIAIISSKFYDIRLIILDKSLFILIEHKCWFYGNKTAVVVKKICEDSSS
jgi:hypothetical protein